MRKIYEFAGGRKIFVGYLVMALLFVGAVYMEEGNYRTFEAGLFAIYASLVLGNVGQKWVESRSNTTSSKTTITNETKDVTDECN